MNSQRPVWIIAAAHVGRHRGPTRRAGACRTGIAGAALLFLCFVLARPPAYAHQGIERSGPPRSGGGIPLTQNDPLAPLPMTRWLHQGFVFRPLPPGQRPYGYPDFLPLRSDGQRLAAFDNYFAPPLPYESTLTGGITSRSSG